MQAYMVKAEGKWTVLKRESILKTYVTEIQCNGVEQISVAQDTGSIWLFYTT
jgi:hypothetical protein